MNRVVFVSLEFLGPLFSGNGQYARSLVRALKSAGFGVLVVSGRRADLPMEEQDDEGRKAAEAPHGVIDVPLPVTLWNRLDRHSAWQEFAAGCASSRVVSAVAAFDASMVFAVDWHGMQAWLAALRSSEVDASKSATLRSLPVCFLNFRVYCTSASLFGGDAAHPDACFYRAAERLCLRSPQVRSVAALCRADAMSLAALAAGVDPLSRTQFHVATGALVEGDEHADATPSLAELHGLGADCGAAAAMLPASPQLFILLPPLRRDIAALATAAVSAASTSACADSAMVPIEPEPGPTERPFFTCCVRLSPEKCPLRFARVAAALLKRTSVPAGAAADGGAVAAAPAAAFSAPLIPLLFGATGDAAYAAQVRHTLAAADDIIGDSSAAGSKSPAVAAAIPVDVVSGLPEAASFVAAHTGPAPSDAAAAPAPRSLQLSRFVGPADLRQIMSHTALNAHPPDSDAYGMTVVEAAAFGAPTLLQLVPASAAGAASASAAAASAASARGISAGAETRSYEPVLQLVSTPVSVRPTGLDADRPLAGFQHVAIRCSSDASSVAPGPTDAAALSPLALAPAHALALIASSSAFPSVGACDLLGSPLPIEELLHPPAGDASAIGAIAAPAASAAPSVFATLQSMPKFSAACVGVDWSSCDSSEGAQRLAETVAAVVASPAACARLRAIAARAQAIALSWIEDDSAAALVALVDATTAPP